MPQPGEIKATDTCGRCGLRRATHALEERGIQIQLCDDCYWGQEPAEAGRKDQPPPPEPRCPGPPEDPCPTATGSSPAEK